MAASVKPLWKISVQTSSEAEDVVTDMLTDVFASQASVYSDVETRETVVSVYVGAMDRRKLETAKRRLAAITEAGINIGPGTVLRRKVKREDWAESWKRHFKPLEIGPLLLVKPSWNRRKPRRGQAVVVLDPGLSFGTGNHPTTAFCLEQLCERRDAANPQSMLDVGCGSGILSIAAIKLGYKPVEAFDFDPDAVRVAKENALANGVPLRVSRRDLTKLPQTSARKFDVVCANLTYDLLISQREKLLARLAKDGSLVLAGILNEQFAAVREAFAAKKMTLDAPRTAGEWTSGAFRRAVR